MHCTIPLLSFVPLIRRIYSAAKRVRDSLGIFMPVVLDIRHIALLNSN